MHKFLRAAGFSMYTKKKDIEKLLDLLERQPSMTKCVQVDEDSNVCEMRTEVAPGLGISIVGELNDDGDFEREFYFPYLESNIVGSTEECSVQRHTEKETYSGMVDVRHVKSVSVPTSSSRIIWQRKASSRKLRSMAGARSR